MSHAFALCCLLAVGQPAPPNASRIGSTHVAGDYYLTTEDYLNEGAIQILNTGMRVIKAYLFKPAGGYPYNSTWPGFSSMVQTAQHPYFQELFNRPFETYVLTAYSFVSTNEHYFRSGVSDTQAAAEEQQFHDLAAYLLTTYRGTGKTFVLQHWEGDWAIRGNYCTDVSCDPSDTAVNGMIRWLNARQDGVTRARNEITDTDVKVYSACEVNLVALAMQGRRTVTNNVLPYTHCDLYSYSSYDIIGQASEDPTLTTSRQAFRDALDYIASKAPDSAAFGNKNVYVGEYGWPEVTSSQDPVASTEKSLRVIRMTTEEALAWGCPYMLYWQVYDNECRVVPPANADARGFYLIKPDGTRAPAWYYFNCLLYPALSTPGVDNPSFEDDSGSYYGWQIAWISGEGPDLPPLDNGNPWGPRTTFGTHFAGKVTSGLRMDFYLGQVIDAANWHQGSTKADWQLSTYVQLNSTNGGGPNPAGVYQTWEIGWNGDGSRPADVMNCEHYQTISSINGNYTDNDGVNFHSLTANGTLTGVPGLRGLAIRVHLFNDGNYSWTLNNIDSVAFEVTDDTPPAPGDFNTDNDVDLDDFGFFRMCFNGPNKPPLFAECSMADFDHDSDVDLADFAVFRSCFNGPNRQPACPQ